MNGLEAHERRRAIADIAHRTVYARTNPDQLDLFVPPHGAARHHESKVSSMTDDSRITGKGITRVSIFHRRQAI